MPYITESRRLDISRGDQAYTPGELQYLIALLLNEYIGAMNLNYQTINDIVGALEGAKLEFYRRIAAPYEDEKILQNGDVY